MSSERVIYYTPGKVATIKRGIEELLEMMDEAIGEMEDERDDLLKEVEQDAKNYDELMVEKNDLEDQLKLVKEERDLLAAGDVNG